jgi:uncharacterized protein
MSLPDFERARQYALNRLEHELSPRLFYHSLWHTQDDVVPSAERLADLAGVTGLDRLLLSTAAWYHDLGFVVQRQNHEEVGAQIAAEVLPQFGYTDEQIERIKGMIMATRLPQSPRNLHEEILADADLDALGRDDFLNRGNILRKEMAEFGHAMADKEWLDGQLEFQESHTYFTEVARALRNPQKEKNKQLVREMLAEFKSPE